MMRRRFAGLLVGLGCTLALVAGCGARERVAPKSPDRSARECATNCRRWRQGCAYIRATASAWLCAEQVKCIEKRCLDGEGKGAERPTEQCRQCFSVRESEDCEQFELDSAKFCEYVGHACDETCSGRESEVWKRLGEGGFDTEYLKPSGRRSK